jgi:outer membrane protein OmpA-like peptidoglycan-associated protein
MRTTVFPARKTIAAIVAISAISLGASAFSQEVKALRGKPNSDMILEALSPATNPDSPVAPAVRKRGLSLGNDTASQPAPAAEQSVQAPAQVQAQPQAPSQPQAQIAAQPQAQSKIQAQPQAQVQQVSYRALDLDIKFQFNSDQLTNDGKDVLDQLGLALKSEKLAGARSVILEGHADAKGSPTYNQVLSAKRAQSALNYLSTRHGIPGAKLKALGKGSSEPADPGNPANEINRRVRVIVGV